MRNLKRALSLALAFVMVMSMMVVGAGAVSVDDFSDGADIVNKEAVTVLATLNVINGKDDGSYDPTGNVTRGEMAKMICVILNGGKDPVLGETLTNSYTDTTSHWAKNYIEYCTNQGIVAGKGDGTFDPNGNVTVAEAAKMVLVALGYNAGVENYVGANWQINVDGRANPLGLYDDLSYTTTSAELTRDNAAQMLYNALDVHMVTYDYIITGTAENALTTKPQINDTDKGTLLEEKFDAVKVEGVVVANEVANLESGADKGAALDANRTRIDIDEDADQEWYTGTQTFKVPSTIDDLGRYVSVYVKRENNSTNAQVLGSVIVSEDNKVVTDYSADPIEDVVDDNNLDLEDNALIAENYKGLTELTSSKASASNTAGQEKILIDNDDDGRVDYVLLNTYYFGKVTSYVTSGDGSITVTDNNNGHPAFTADDKDDVVGFDDVAKDDYVIAAWIGGDLHVALADTVTGNLEGYKENDKNLVTKLTVDGEDYSVSHVDGYTGGVDDIRAAKTYGEEYLDNEATFYLTKGGYIAAAGEVDENAYKYALVLATGTTGLEDRVRVALSDGTTATYDYVTSGNAVKNPQVGTVYRYTINSAGDIRLTAITATTKTGTASFEKGLTAVKAGSDTLYASGSTAFFYVGVTTLGGSNIDSSDVSVYAGYQNAPDLDNNPAIKAVVYPREGNENSNRAGAVVFYGDASLATGNVDDVLYISDKGTSTTDYTNADAFIAGNKVSDQESTIKVDITSPLTRRVAYTYTINSDGYYELETLAANEYVSGKVTNTSSTTFVVGGKELKVTSNTLLVDDSEYRDAPAARTGDRPEENDNVLFAVYNNDMEAVLVVVRNTESGGQTVSSYDTQVTVSGGRVEVRYYGTQPAPGQVAELLTKIDGISNVRVNGSNLDFTHNGIDYTNIAPNYTPVYKVTYNGTDSYKASGETVAVADQTSSKLLSVTTSGSTTTYAVATGVTGNATNGYVYTMPAAGASPADIVLVDGYSYTTGVGTVTLPTGVTAASGSGVNYVPAGTVLSVAASSATQSVTATYGATTVTVVDGTTAKNFEMPAANVTLAETVTPTDLTVDFAAKAGQGGQADWDNASKVYTTKDGQKFTIAIEDAVAGQNAKITATPVADFVAGSVTLTFENSGEIGKISFSAGDPSSARGFTTILAGDATVEISDNTSAAYVLTVPAGIGVSGATPFETNKYLVAAGSVTLTGLTDDFYYVVDGTTDVATTKVSGGQATFTMASENMTVLSDTYVKVTLPTNITGGSGSNQAFGNYNIVVTTLETVAGSSYVKTTDDLTVTITWTGNNITTGSDTVTIAAAGATLDPSSGAQTFTGTDFGTATDKEKTVTISSYTNGDLTITATGSNTSNT